jgi:murein DD-endopeptidase MepM/ murein hydrolase activator NlpD
MTRISPQRPGHRPISHGLRLVAMGSALVALAACTGPREGATGGGGGGFGTFDWDLRNGNGVLNTSDAALQATESRPAADGRGVISYPGYQVAVARRGDTVGSVAARVGISGDELARYNALQTGDPLREGEIIALPRRVEGAPLASPPPIGGTSTATAPVDVSSIATTALDRVGTPTPPATTKPNSGGEPVRHQVKRGETAFSIARSYNVSAKSLGEWNGLGPDLAVREGQYLIIPLASASAPPRREVVTAPGAGSPTPTPPSAAKPLPTEKTAPAASKPKDTPASPDLAKNRTAASAAKMVMPAQGSIIRPYAKGKNEGIDIGASAGSSVKAADAGTIAAITKDTEQRQIIVIRHADNILTVYAGVDSITVKKGDKVSRGQAIAKVRNAQPAFLHFEVRKGVESTNPLPFVQ